MTITATPDEVREAKNSALVMVAYWGVVLEQPLGTFAIDETRDDRAARLVRYIEETVDVFPLLGRHFLPCSNSRCDRLVDDLTERDEFGRLWCDDGCRDDEASTQQERWEAHALDVVGAGAHLGRLHAGPPRDFILRRF